MKTIKKIFNIKDYHRKQSYAYQNIGQQSENKGDRIQVPHLKVLKIGLIERQNAIVQSWFKSKKPELRIGYSTIKK